MTPFESITDARAAITAHFMNNMAPADEGVRAALLEASAAPSPVDLIMGTLEALYSAKSNLGADGKMLVAQLADFAVQNGWHGINAEGRGLGMTQAMLRELGEPCPSPRGWPDASSDPAPHARFVTPLNALTGEGAAAA